MGAKRQEWLGVAEDADGGLFNQKLGLSERLCASENMVQHQMTFASVLRMLT